MHACDFMVHCSRLEGMPAALPACGSMACTVRMSLRGNKQMGAIELIDLGVAQKPLAPAVSSLASPLCAAYGSVRPGR